MRTQSICSTSVTEADKQKVAELVWRFLRANSVTEWSPIMTTSLTQLPLALSNESCFDTGRGDSAALSSARVLAESDSAESP